MRVQISEFLTWRFGRDLISRMGLDLDNKSPRALLNFFRIQQNNSNDKMINIIKNNSNDKNYRVMRLNNDLRRT